MPVSRIRIALLVFLCIVSPATRFRAADTLPTQLSDDAYWGQYLRDHGAVVGAYYLSNVENYLFQNQGGQGNPNGGATNFYANVATLPLDSSSTFIRSRSGGGGGGRGAARPPNELASIQKTLEAVKDGRIKVYQDVFNVPIYQGDVPGILERR